MKICDDRLGSAGNDLTLQMIEPVSLVVSSALQ